MPGQSCSLLHLPFAVCFICRCCSLVKISYQEKRSFELRNADLLHRDSRVGLAEGSPRRAEGSAATSANLFYNSSRFTHREVQHHSCIVVDLQCLYQTCGEHRHPCASTLPVVIDGCAMPTRRGGGSREEAVASAAGGVGRASFGAAAREGEP